MSLLAGYTSDLSQEEWDKRFKWNFNKDGEVNHAGYGPNKPYVPPLENPTTIYGLQERHDILLSTGSIFAISNPLIFWGMPFMIFW